MDEEQHDDKAQEAHQQVIPGVSSGALLDAMENPEKFEQIARADLYVQMAHMRRAAAHPEFSANARMEYTKFLARMGKVDAPAKDANVFDNVPLISIVLPNSGGAVSIGAPPPTEKAVIEGEALDTGFGSKGGKPSEAVIP